MISLISIALGALAAQAAIVPRANPNCITVHKGVLSASLKGDLHPFSTTTSGLLTYTGNNNNPLSVEFQACLPPNATLGSGGGNGEYTGRLFVPAKKQCVSITNQEAAYAPYYVAVSQCLESGSQDLPVAAQAFIYHTAPNNTINWYGKTDEEGTQPQGGCGQFGYKSHGGGIPTLTTSGQVQLQCYSNSTAFHLA